MNEKNKKVSLLTKIDDAIYHKGNSEINEYIFYSAYLVILNCVQFNTKDNNMVKITLHLDEFILELYSKENKVKSFSVPYSYLDSFYIFLEDDENDDKKRDNES